MTERVCFVIMPYGGGDENRRKHYLGVYQSIIKPAAAAAGFATKRSDIAGQPGSITKDIIEDLARAEVVIADLSEGNPNVLFELGIRHALRKSGTIHIVNKQEHIPFDVRQYRAVEYSVDLSELGTSVAEIASAIGKRLEQPARSDNPVHDTLPELPMNVLAQGSEDQSENIKRLQERLEALSTENDQLKGALGDLEADPLAQSERDLDALFDEADGIMQTTGENVLLHLNNALQQGGKDALVAKLREVIKSPYLTESDLAAINNLCAELDLDAHRLAVLNEARRRFPESKIFLKHYTQVLLLSPSPDRKAQGQRVSEEFFGVEKTDDGISVGHPERITEVDELFPLFDHYVRIDRPLWALELITAAEPVVGAVPLLLRNKARALAKLRRFDEAEGVFKEAISQSPDDDTLFAFYSDFLDDSGRYEEAYEQIEHALSLDPQDGTRYINVAIQILNRGYCRAEGGNIRQIAPRKARMKAAAPFLIGAVQKASTNNRLQDVISIFVREHMIEEAQALARGETPKGDFDYASFDRITGTNVDSHDSRAQQEDPGDA